MVKLIAILGLSVMAGGCIRSHSDGPPNEVPVDAGSDGGGGGNDGSAGSGSNGVYCSVDSDCPPGAACDRDSDGTSTCQAGLWCIADTDCNRGQYCDPARETCAQLIGCASAGDCAAGLTCEPTLLVCIGIEPAPVTTCYGTVTCTHAPPSCPADQRPLVAAGCYTGGCRELAACEPAPPACNVIGDEATCLTRSDCQALYTGSNCTGPAGAPCDASGSACTCTTFAFSSCTERNP